MTRRMTSKKRCFLSFETNEKLYRQCFVLFADFVSYSIFPFSNSNIFEHMTDSSLCFQQKIQQASKEFLQ